MLRWQGPILGGTFGTVMQNKSLRNLGIKNELIGLFICVISGEYTDLKHSASCNSNPKTRGPTHSKLTLYSKRSCLRYCWRNHYAVLPKKLHKMNSNNKLSTGALWYLDHWYLDHWYLENPGFLWSNCAVPIKTYCINDWNKPQYLEHSPVKLWYSEFLWTLYKNSL